MSRVRVWSARELFFSFFKFSKRRGKPRSVKARLWLEELENRVTPSAIPVTIFTDSANISSGSLRAAIIQADTNADTTPTITLAAGTYTLDLSSPDGATPDP